MFSINVAVPLSLSLRSHSCCSSSREGGILRAGRKASSPSPPPTSTSPTPTSTTGASTVRAATRSVLQHGQLAFLVREDLSQKKERKKNKKEEKKKLFDNKQQKPCTLNPADGHAFFPFVIAGAIAFCGEARG